MNNDANILKGKRLFFLGSSVTYGSAAGGVSFVDLLAERTGCVCTKSAVSGTTLADTSEDSYVARLARDFDTSEKCDHFICQLSTNDASLGVPLGKPLGQEHVYDTKTICGAIEHIISYVKANWQCPISFYTGTYFDSEDYQAAVDALHEIANEWGVGVLDMWNDEKMRAVDHADYVRYMDDPVHPTLAGYSEWWTPVFEKYLRQKFTAGEYSKAEERQMPELIAFIDKVFGVDKGFAVSIPKVYANGKGMAHIHHMMTENGAVKAVVAVYPHDYTLGGKELKTGFIGSVSVDGECRGKGYMKTLMTKADEEMRENGFDLALLDGKRQRYNYFGYEKGSAVIRWHVDSTNLRHIIRDKRNENLSVMQVQSPDDALLDDIFGLYNTRIMTGRTRAEFYDVAVSYCQELYALLDGGECAGYFILMPDKTIVTELVLRDAGQIPYALFALMEAVGQGHLVISTSFDMTDINRALADICEYSVLLSERMMKIYNWEKVLGAMLTARASYASCADGSVVIEIEGFGRYEMIVSGGRASVCASDKQADVTLSPTEVVRLLTTPDGLMFDLPVPRSWLPLHFSITEPDCF